MSSESPKELGEKTCSRNRHEQKSPVKVLMIDESSPTADNESNHCFDLMAFGLFSFSYTAPSTTLQEFLYERMIDE